MNDFKLLTKRLKELEQFLGELENYSQTLSFDPFDAESIENALIQMENMIDGRGQYSATNPMIEKIASELKDKYRKAIIDKAAKYRAVNGGE